MTTRADALFRGIVVAGLVALALLLRVWYMADFAASPLFACPLGPDVMEYDMWAKRILSGELWWGELHIHAPLYPYFLALCYKLCQVDYGVVRWTQQILGLLVALPLYLALRTARVPSLARWLAVTLWALYPPLVYYQGELTSETLALPLLALSILCLYRGERGARTRFGWIAMAGLFAGLANVTHPVSLFFTAAELLYFTLSGLRPKRLLKAPKGCAARLGAAALFAAAAAAAIGPVAWRNRTVLHERALIQANSGFNFYLGNNPRSDGTCYLRPGPEWDKTHLVAGRVAGASKHAQDQFFFRRAFAYINSRPSEWAGKMCDKALYVWNNRELTAGADLNPVRYYTGLQQATPWAFGALGTLAMTALMMNLRRRSFLWKHRHFLLLVMAYWLAQTLFVTSGRYRMAMLLGLVPLAAWNVRLLLIFPWRFKTCAKAALCLAGAICVVYLPTPPFDPAREAGEAASLYGEALLRSAHPAEAIPHLEQAAAAMPGWTRGFNLLGAAFADLGRGDAARENYLKALALSPQDPITLSNLAIYHEQNGMPDKAQGYYDLALRHIDNVQGYQQANIFYNLGLFSASKGKNRQAMMYYEHCLAIAPEHREALNNLAALYLMADRGAQAVELLEKATLFEPDNPRLWINLALARSSVKDRKGAEAAASEALWLKPDLKNSSEYLELIKYIYR